MLEHLPLPSFNLKMIVGELANEFTETILPIAALVGLLIGGFFTHEVLALSNNDPRITVKAATIFAIGAIAPGVVGFLLCARISSSLATELQTAYLKGLDPSAQFQNQRLFTLAVGGFIACISYQAMSIIGAVIAAEYALPGASVYMLELLLTERHPMDWCGDALLSAAMGAAIGYAAILSANQGSRMQREISRTAGRAVSYGLIAVCGLELMYWLIRQTI